ncbi:hypothetical protein [Mesorhizobium xinjiangense]|uniref:hypothetical protein n=1 Tax=Mesorhizobium xinjiangense TaxID=2678685 RepID=UPI0012ED5C79|nr:hypothetical protein [Mesorhizobium xinjiangense]
MLALFSSPAFWFGAAVLSFSQVGKFCEFSAPQTTPSPRSNLIAQLRPRDFTDAWTFNAALAAFLLASFAAYTLLCSVPPGVLEGWMTIAGGDSGRSHLTDPSIFPLIVAAMMVGLTQPFPGLDRIANFQKEVFHRWIGIPEHVARISAHFADEILARSDGPEALAAELEQMLSDQWIHRIGAFADTSFYSDYVGQMKLDRQAELDEIRQGSSREKRFVVQDLIFAAAVATVKSGGGRALPKLAKALAVSMPDQERRPKAWSSGILVFLLCAVVLWVVLPMSSMQTFVDGALGKRESWDFWPASPAMSGLYLLSNYVPLFFAVVVVNMLALERLSSGSETDDRSVSAIVERYALPIVLVVVAIILYDYAQALMDRGAFDGAYDGSVWTFIIRRLPFFCLHAMAPAIAALILVVFTIRADLRSTLRERIAWAAGLAAIVGLVSYFYAVGRLEFQFQAPPDAGRDFRYLVVVLHVASALVAFAAVNFAIRRHAARFVRTAPGGTSRQAARA